MTQTNFEHRQTAHCETGSLTNLLRFHGLDISEAMAFGISEAITFAYIPFVKIGGLPLIAYRRPPGGIIKSLSSRLGIVIKYERFRSSEKGMKALINHLGRGQPVGLQTSVYWLPYFPAEMRFHFNAHNLVAYDYSIGEGSGEFSISDPTFETTVKADYESLEKARFVKGIMAPKGLMYYPTSIPDDVNLKAAIVAAISANCRTMLKSPFWLVGVRGIQHVSRKIAKFDARNERKNLLFLGHMVRMQEEIGTGGGGFRFLYAAFIQEAAQILSIDALEPISKEFTAIGDRWRMFALNTAKMVKGRKAVNYQLLSNELAEIAELEKVAYSELYSLITKI